MHLICISLAASRHTTLPPIKEAPSGPPPRFSWWHMGGGLVLRFLKVGEKGPGLGPFLGWGRSWGWVLAGHHPHGITLVTKGASNNSLELLQGEPGSPSTAEAPQDEGEGPELGPLLGWGGPGGRFWGVTTSVASPWSSKVPSWSSKKLARPLEDSTGRTRFTFYS